MSRSWFLSHFLIQEESCFTDFDYNTQPELNKIGFTLRVTVQSLYSINLFNGAPLGLCNLSKLWNPIFPFSSRFSHKMHSSHFYADTAWLCENRGTEKEVSFGIFNLIHQRPRQRNSFVEVIARSVHVKNNSMNILDTVIIIFAIKNCWQANIKEIGTAKCMWSNLGYTVHTNESWNKNQRIRFLQ